jgi:RNA polymerase sigma-70 factor (ECF subfamily)
MGLAVESDKKAKAWPGTTSLQVGILSDRSVPQQATVTDVEVFIRQAFKTDPKQGCELLFQHYYQPLCNHAVRLLYSKAIAEDLVSEIFYQFYRQETYRHITTSYRAYLYKAVRNSVINYVRWEANRSADLAACADFPGLACQQPDAMAEYEELYQQVEAAINSLPPQRRKVYLLHRFENKKYAEIAAELQLSVRTVEVQIRKASLFLKGLLRSQWLLLLLSLLPF